jgi:maltooligosyltrehalose trehalohydrolase
MTSTSKRRLPVGAELNDAGVHFRVWAPRRRQVDVVIDGRAHALHPDGEGGYFAGVVANARAGTRYKFRLDGGGTYPDPASRYQPEGPHGDSEVVDPYRFRWTDAGWRGVSSHRQVIYEMHVGTFTPEGTFAAAAEQLVELADLGITVVEMMPVAEFPGRFGWGYDGVDLFAPFHGYGSPDDLRAFVDRAHDVGVGVILDVVYNHFGPDGNYLGEYSAHYISTRHETEWGGALNFDGEGCKAVREFVLSNAAHWIREYHFDGLRLDATHSIADDSRPHILEEIGTTARAAAGDRDLLIVAETEPQDARIVRPRDRGGFGLDQIWCDDFHHLALVAATGRREAYFTDYRGTAQEFVSAIKYGVLYQGQRYRWQNKRRGAAAWDMEPHQCVFYLENHDQVANSRDGSRLHQLASPSRYRALTAVLLLTPQTPLLFQGQEFASSAPFLYFADHNPELNALVRKGREEFLRQFPSMRDAPARRLDDPGAPATFERCRLDASERRGNAAHVALHRDLIALRQCDPVFCADTTRIDGAILAERAFAVRFFTDNGTDRLLIVNLGEDRELDIVPEPLLAPPDLQRGWRRLWYSDDPCYGGRGAPPVETPDGVWRIPSESATLLAPDA